MDKNIEDVKIIERYLILLLGVVERPIPSPVHIQKELFLLSKANPKISDFIYFDRHYMGPFSNDLDDISKNPVYHSDIYFFDKYRRLYITKKGKKVFSDIVKKYDRDSRFKELLSMIKMIREIYDKLSKDELLFLIYITYKEYTERSQVSDNLLSQKKRKILSKSLLDKGLISEKRYSELVGS